MDPGRPPPPQQQQLGGEMFRCEEGEKQQEALTLLPPPSSSSSTSSSPTRWTGEEPPGPVPASRVEKEHLFDKVVTPSDVGKLNRLVIPKQHAERYFPLDSAANEKGLLLNFEDREGKPWRFRYSYWNSSQSYVMTKGWSRFVKEKRLDAGDTVSFSRGVGDSARDRLFIDWKRRPEPQDRPRLPLPGAYAPMMSFGRSVVPWSRLQPPPHPPPVYLHDHRPPSLYGYAGPSAPYLYLRSVPPSQFGVQFPATASQFVVEPTPLPATDWSPGNISPPKRVRLFGVDLADNSGLPASQPPSTIPLHLSIGPAGSTNDDDDDDNNTASKDKQPLSLDLDM